MKILLIILGVIVIIVVIVAGYFWYSMSKPLYQPGDLSAGKNLRSPLAPPVQNGDPDFWQIETGIQLHHFSQGEGQNVLIVHGGPGFPNAEPWSGLEPLAGQYKFHYYDQRGSGESTRPFDKFDSQNTYNNMTELETTLGIGAQLADIERIRQILGDDKIILIGHSFGGFLASLYAAEFPQNVSALVLVAPAETLVFPPPSGGLFEQVRQRLPEELQMEYDAYIGDYLDFQGIFSKSENELVELNNKFSKYYRMVYPSDMGPQAKPGGWMVWAMYISMGQRHDYSAALADVAAPVLVIHGANDLQPEEASRLYTDAFPNASFAVIDGATHFPFREQPDEFARITGEFLSGLPEN